MAYLKLSIVLDLYVESIQDSRY